MTKNSQRRCASHISVALVLFLTVSVDFAYLCAESQAQLNVPNPLNSATGTGINNNTTSIQTVAPANLLTQQIVTIFLNQVAGIDMNNYNIASFDVSTNQVRGSQKLQTFVTAIISNDQEKLGISMVLIEGKVRFYDLTLLSGTLEGAQISISDTLRTAKTAIDSYKTKFNASYCTGFDQIVPETVQSQNLTIKNEVTTLNIECSGDTAPQLKYAKFSWYKTINGVAIPAQSVQATVSKTGILTSFADNLGLYKIGTINVVVAKDEAIDISMPYIYAYAEENNRKIETMIATLQYAADFNGSRGDSYLVYPLWEVSAKFDSSKNPIFGYTVLVWADNGVVRSEGAQGNFQPVTANSPLYAINPSIIIGFAIVAFGAIMICVRQRIGIRQWRTKTGLKIATALSLVAVLIFPLIVQPSLALPSTIFGSTYDIYDETEISLDRQIAGYIETWSQSAGWTPYNWYEEDTTESNFYVGAYDHGEAGSLVFHIGHGGVDQGEYWIRDNSGTQVSATSIYDNSIDYSSGHHKFALIWSCEQGNEISGMPRAWLHTTSLSSDGYQSPDNSGQAFIGFEDSAPFLSNDYDSVSDAGYYLLYDFYSAVLNQGFNLNAALDYSTQALWQEDFDESIFGEGIPGMGRMLVYGQGNLYASERSYVSSISTYNWSGDAAGIDNPNYMVGAQNDGQFAHLHAGEYGSQAYIVGVMNVQRSGHIEICGYSGTGYYTHLYVYVSSDNQNWTYVSNQYVTANSAYTIDCGYAANNFGYVKIAVYDDEWWSACLYVDAVHVRA